MVNQRDNETRIAYLLRVLEQYMTDYGEFTVDYDGKTCDGMCLFEDIRDQMSFPTQVTGFLLSYSEEARSAVSLELKNAAEALSHPGATVESGGISVTFRGASKGRFVSITSDLVLHLGDDVP